MRKRPSLQSKWRLLRVALVTVPLPIRTRIAVKAGLLAAGASRKLGRGEGSVIGGRVTLALDPRSLAFLAAGRTTALVSGTNGKTTTTAMLTAALSTAGDVVTNDAGSNMFGGMVGALSRSDARLVVLETDEAHLPKTMTATKPRLILLLNLTRDQLDRVSEVRMLAAKWRDAVRETNAIVVANADDPMVVWAAQAASKVIWAEGGGLWRLDAASCPQCGSEIVWNDGDWACVQCDLRRPQPHAEFTNRVPQTAELRLRIDLNIPGDINKHNAVLALTGSIVLGADPAKAAQATREVRSPGGRFILTSIGGVSVRLLLAKNPAGWAESLRITGNDDNPVVVAINARIQDGRDPSWLWDVPFEQLANRFVVATGDRGRDLAVRLQYAGVDHKFVSDLTAAVKRANTERPGTTIDVVGNYSAFQDARTRARINP